MNKNFILLILMVNTILTFSQDNDEDKNIYNTVLDYYFSKYHEDTTKTILLIDSTTTINNTSLNTIIEITRKYYDEGNYYSYYHDFLDVDTSDFKNIEKINKQFFLQSLKIEKLTDLLGYHKNIKFVHQSYIESVFYPFRSINSYNNIDSVVNVLNSCWLKLSMDMNCLGYCSFSRPYFLDQNKALIYFSFMHGSLAGMSAVYILKKESNVWEVKRIITIGVS